MIRRVYEVDPLICARCGGTMKIVALIHRPEVIKRILSHLKLGPVDGAPVDGPGRAQPSTAASSGASPSEPNYEPNRPPDDEPIGDRA